MYNAYEYCPYCGRKKIGGSYYSGGGGYFLWGNGGYYPKKKKYKWPKKKGSWKWPYGREERELYELLEYDAFEED